MAATVDTTSASGVPDHSTACSDDHARLTTSHSDHHSQTPSTQPVVSTPDDADAAALHEHLHTAHGLIRLSQLVWIIDRTVHTGARAYNARELNQQVRFALTYPQRELNTLYMDIILQRMYNSGTLEDRTLAILHDKLPKTYAHITTVNDDADTGSDQ